MIHLLHDLAQLAVHHHTLSFDWWRPHRPPSWARTFPPPSVCTPGGVCTG